MACYTPLPAIKTEDGTMKFNFKSGEGDVIKLPCGQCMGCRIDRSRMWAVRCMHEATQYEKNCFITLTYAPEHLPSDLSLNYRHFQLFMKRLRQKYRNNNIRFYMCGEYGETNQRPHYHAIIFNFDFPDKIVHSKSRFGDTLHTSQSLTELWGKGHCLIGEATENSAGYVARYIVQKFTGKLDDINPKTGRPFGAKYERFEPTTGEIWKVQPEFNKMSLKPGIGQAWFDKYYTDVYPADCVRMRDGRTIKPPRFYDKKYDAKHPYEFDEIKQDRIMKALKNFEEATPERLAVKEQILQAKFKTTPLLRTL